LGFTNVLDYVPGKQDWLANGFPSDGKRANLPRIGDLARKDVPTCALSETVGRVKQRVADAGWDMAVAISEEGVILGLLRDEQLASLPDLTVEQVMQEGPSTWRPNLGADRMVRHAVRFQLPHLVVSTSEGVLVGVLRRSDIDRLAGAIDRLGAGRPSDSENNNASRVSDGSSEDEG
jgi:signal-transduction protein with cAMP-binding, CBS, and nucleotidyltransferase domain